MHWFILWSKCSRWMDGWMEVGGRISVFLESWLLLWSYCTANILIKDTSVMFAQKLSLSLHCSTHEFLKTPPHPHVVNVWLFEKNSNSWWCAFLLTGSINVCDFHVYNFRREQKNQTSKTVILNWEKCYHILLKEASYPAN